MKKKLIAFLLVGFAVFCMTSMAHANAIQYSYIGSYAVFDGPLWTTNPPVYSAREAASLIFGGDFSDYAISIDSNTVDPSTITFTGWYDGWGEHSGMIFDQDYKLDLGNPGYDDPNGVFGAARSAYVEDGLFDTQTYRNYVWEANPVPEPTTMFLLGTGLVGVAGAARRKKKNQA